MKKFLQKHFIVFSAILAGILGPLVFEMSESIFLSMSTLALIGVVVALWAIFERED